MKKKILLLAFLILAISCIFAISVSAETPSMYIEFGVKLEGSTDYITAYTQNAESSGNPRINLNYEFYSDVDFTQVIDKSTIIGIDFSNATAYGSEKKVITRMTASSTPLTNCEELKMPTNTSFELGNVMFKDWTGLKRLDLGTVTKVDYNAFQNTGIEELVIPTTVKMIGNSAFRGCGSLRSVKFEGNVSSMGTGMFYDCTALEEVWMVADIGAFSDNVFNKSATNCVFYYTGTKEQLDTLKNNTKTNNTAFYNAYNQAMSFEQYSELETKSGAYIVYGVNHCYAFYDNKHTLTGTDCTKADVCKICSLPIEAQASHTMVESLVYESFVENGLYLCDCTFNGCTAADVVEGDEKSVALPIFSAGSGFSTNGDDGIAGGYSVNVSKLNEYNRVNKDNKLTVGIMVVNPNYLDGKSSFLDKNGKVNASSGALQFDMSATEYANINVLITNFAGEAKNISLIIALYAYSDVDEVEFIQSQTTRCASENVTLGEQTLYTVTLDSVKSANSSLSSLGDYVMPSQKQDN